MKDRAIAISQALIVLMLMSRAMGDRIPARRWFGAALAVTGVAIVVTR